MSGASHTPGPWKAYEQEARSGCWSIAGEDTVADLWRLGEEDHCRYPLEEERAEANARLIAAAPELLAFAEGLDCECDSYHGHTCKRCIAIAKARGAA